MVDIVSRGTHTEQMPDRDVIPRTIRPRWRQAARLAREANSPSVVGGLLEKAVYQTIREGTGYPDVVAVVDRPESQFDLEVWRQCLDLEKLDDPLVERAYQRLSACEPWGTRTRPPEAMLELVLSDLVRAEVFDRLRPFVVGATPFPTAAQWDRYCSEVITHAALGEAAHRWLKSRSGGQLRRPSRTRTATADMLEVPVDEL